MKYADFCTWKADVLRLTGEQAQTFHLHRKSFKELLTDAQSHRRTIIFMRNSSKDIGKEPGQFELDNVNVVSQDIYYG